MTARPFVVRHGPRLWIGGEAPCSHRETRDGSNGDVVRSTAGLVRSIFD